MIICKCQMIEYRRVSDCDHATATSHIVKKYIKLFETEQQMKDYVKETNRQNNKFNIRDIRVDCYKIDSFDWINSITMEDCRNNTLPEIMELFNVIRDIIRNGDKGISPKI